MKSVIFEYVTERIVEIAKFDFTDPNNDESQSKERLIAVSF